MNVDLQIPDVHVASLDTSLRQIEIDESLCDVQVKGVDTPKYIALDWQLKTPTLWKKIEKSISKILQKK